MEERQTGMTPTWEPVPSYWKFVQDSIAFLNKNRPVETENEIPLNFHTSHVIYVVIGAVIWTILRARLNEHVTKPISRRFHLTKRREEDLQVNLWALLYNVGAAPLLFYSVVLRHELFQRPSTVWEDCCGEVETSWDINLNYLLWASYEVHLMYALYFVEDWASDTLLYTVHHGVTLALLILSYSLGYGKIGLLVLSMLETTNIPLKLMKCLSAFRFQDGKEFTVITKLCTTVLYIFGFSWFLFRLHWYPLKAVYAAENIPKRLQLTTSLRYQYYCVVMLLFLLFLNIFWFMLVLKLILKVTMGKPPKKHES